MLSGLSSSFFSTWTSDRNKTLSKIRQLPENQIQELVRKMELAINTNTNITEISPKFDVCNSEIVDSMVGTLLNWDLLTELKTLGLVQQIEDKLTRYRNGMLRKVLQLPTFQLQELVRKMASAMFKVSEQLSTTN